MPQLCPMVRETKEILRFDRWERRLLRLVRRSEGLIRIQQLDFSTPTRSGQRWPIYLLEVGKRGSFRNHTVSVVSGVHGLETIGIRMHLDLLKCLINPKSQFYSKDIARGKLGIYSIPILNPAGVARETRANARGVDLNRNSGVRAENALPFFGGHGISAALPYFQGKALQRESRALFRFLREFALRRRKQVQLALDIHSGYGTQNFLWWPYSYSKRTVFQNSAFQAVADRLRQRHPLYRIEPMSLSYQTHGDLWDKALLDFEHRVKEGQYKKSLFLPFTLEIGTWHEIKKNPRRLLSREKIFNPPAESRKAYLREHRAMLWDFLHSYVDRSHRRLLRGRIRDSD